MPQTLRRAPRCALIVSHKFLDTFGGEFVCDVEATGQDKNSVFANPDYLTLPARRRSEPFCTNVLALQRCRSKSWQPNYFL